MFQKIIFLILILSFCGLGQTKITLIPEIIEINNYIVDKPDTIKIKLIVDAFNKEILRKNKNPQCKIDSVNTFDFDNSNLFYFAYWSCGERYDYFDIYTFNKNNLMKVGQFNVYWTHFAVIKNGMPQIIRTYYEGHKTNPIHFTKTYAYKGIKYEEIQNDHLKLGEYRDIGLKAYSEGNYDKALICFQNILRPVWHSGRINPIDYNNLALVYIKLGEYQKVDEILHKALALNKNKDVTFFNLGILSEKQGITSKAIEFYQKSNIVKPSKMKTEKIDELINNNK